MSVQSQVTPKEQGNHWAYHVDVYPVQD